MILKWKWLCSVLGHAWGSPVTVKPRMHDLQNLQIERVQTCLRCEKQRRYLSRRLARWAE